ncbi:MAG TPA: hypothetical protein VGT03_03985 [Candidatus Acidoferrales bacterium]|nr:hypothetical protein [Candidatus Acidoferrales bacterium]
MEPKGAISVWFFVGVSLLVNGLLVFGAGLYELSHPPEFPVVLYNLHASIWWGAALAILGAIYCFYYSPGRHSQS